MMDYAELIEAEKGQCVEMIGVLIGKGIAARDRNEFEGLSRAAYLVAWQEFVNLLTEEQKEILRSFQPPT